MSDSVKINHDFFPVLSEAGKKMLDDLLNHPAAPIYRNQSGHRLLSTEIEALRLFENEIRAAKVFWPKEGKPAWLDFAVQKTFDEVPYYKNLGNPPRKFEDIPPVSRADLAKDIARFVPDSVSIDRLINFRTTGTTGHPLLIASHPIVAARYLAFHKRALDRFGIELAHGQGQVGVVLIGMQNKCFTYVSVTPSMNESGLAKINLHPNDWHDPDDRQRYLEALDPEVIAGDPLSFAELLKLSVNLKPRALFSVGMALSGGLRALLEKRFACPVLDFYSMNEVGPIAVYDPSIDGHVLLQNRLYVEILDTEGQPVPEGEEGEITFTGGFNFCLPLLRYRSGDYASLIRSPDGELVLRRLNGRKPVRFLTQNGNWINNIDVTHALTPLPLSQYGLHQYADGRVALRLASEAMSYADLALSRLEPIFGDAQASVEEINIDGKFMQYTTDLDATIS